MTMSHTSRDLLSWLVIAVDRRQRKRLGIWEFSDDPGCILRLGIARASIDARLADGTRVQPGDTVGVIHLWNDHMPQIPAGGADLAWAREFKRRLVHSFQLLARHVEDNPDLAEIQALGGQLPLVYTPATTRLLQRLGVELFDPLPARSPAGRALRTGALLWTWLLRRAFNPGSTLGLRLRDLEHRPAWFSRATLLRLHGSQSLASRDAP